MIIKLVLQCHLCEKFLHLWIHLSLSKKSLLHTPRLQYLKIHIYSTRQICDKTYYRLEIMGSIVFRALHLLWLKAQRAETLYVMNWAHVYTSAASPNFLVFDLPFVLSRLSKLSCQYPLRSDNGLAKELNILGLRWTENESNDSSCSIPIIKTGQIHLLSQLLHDTSVTKEHSMTHCTLTAACLWGGDGNFSLETHSPTVSHHSSHLILTEQFLCHVLHVLQDLESGQWAASSGFPRGGQEVEWASPFLI